MPALKAFGIKWKISGDDLVFPYAFSIIMKLLWFVSIGYVLVDYNKAYQCNDEKMLKFYLIVLVAIQIIMIIIEIMVVLFSAKGTIANPGPRKHLKWVLYVQAAWFIVEFAWDCVGVIWAFDPLIDCPMSHQVLVLVRIVLIWNLASSVSITMYLVIRVGICGLWCKRTPKTLKYEQLEPSTSFSGRRLSTLSTDSIAQHHRQRKWQWRLQKMFFFLNLRDRQKSVFSEVSATLADAFTKFRGYVPSDVLAGMALLRMKQSRERKDSYNYGDHSATRKRIYFTEEGMRNHGKKITHYMQFSMGGYGWTFYVYSKGLFGVINLIFSSMKCFVKKASESNLVRTILGDNCLKWNLRSIMKLTGINETDIVYANFNSEVYCPSFYVALDHKWNSVVVVIRGTLSVVDALTDLSAQPGLLMTKDAVKFYAHKGMMNTANALHIKLEGEGILQRIFQAYPSYKLVITGHSLGAGVAALLAMCLQPIYPKLHCFAYAPPGGLINMPAVHHTRPFVTSVVLGNDLVPRLSLQNFEKFSERVLHQLSHNNIPKYRIFITSFFHWCGLYKPRYPTEAENIQTKIMSDVEINKFSQTPVLESDEELFDDDDKRKEERKPLIIIDPLTGKRIMAPRKKPPLYLPGRIIHLTKGPLLCKFFGLIWYRPIIIEWVTQSEFSEMMIDEEMVSDHMPDALYTELVKLEKQERLHIV